MKQINPCYMCDNARINDDLTDETDFGSFSLGSFNCDFDKGYHAMISTGYSKPLRVKFSHYNEKIREWEIVGIFYPKYCPNCGREIYEYGRNENA